MGRREQKRNKAAGVFADRTLSTIALKITILKIISSFHLTNRSFSKEHFYMDDGLIFTFVMNIIWFYPNYLKNHQKDIKFIEF